MAAKVETEKKKRVARPKLRMDDLPTRIAQTAAGEDYMKVCIKSVFDRIKFQSNHMRRPEIPNANINVCLPRKLAENLERMGISQLLPTQRYTLSLMVDHDTDLFVEAATGHGKTLAFLIPVAVNLLSNLSTCASSGRPSALVVANTQVLQLQTYNVAKSLLQGTGLKVVMAVGETNVQEHRKEIAQGVDILIATTGRLNQFLDQNVVKLDALKYFIFDEADKMIKNDAFVQELEKISARIPEEIRPTLRSCFFTATFGEFGDFRVPFRQDKICVVKVPGNPLITHNIIPLESRHDNPSFKANILMKLLEKDVIDQGRTLDDQSDKPYLKKTVVFAGRKNDCSFLAAYLSMHKFSVGTINGNYSLPMRNKVMQQFCDGKIQALIATDSMARGHDIPDVTHVINYDVSDLVSFKHRAGRTARIGHKGTCTTLLSRDRFYLYDNPMFTETLGARKEAAKLAGYLLIECGQRIPKCLELATIHRLEPTNPSSSTMSAIHCSTTAPQPEQRANGQHMNAANGHRNVVLPAPEFDEDGNPIFPVSAAEQLLREGDSSDDDYDEAAYMRGVGSVVAVPEWSDEEIERGRAKERERAEAREEARLENEAPDRLSDFDNSDGELDEEEQEANYAEFEARQRRQEALEQEQLEEEHLASLNAEYAQLQRQNVGVDYDEDEEDHGDRLYSDEE
ncbi:hypothetical protein PRIPAC_77146 [Pristionchus pacificus]|uniref:Helicase n=1 Tax=Pristionchus pacificus TaxID=54126 RepID=A0A2A6BHI8_PRIPA|nr:hypothetical protein PRIPAC_77146 [Pristionchus pacificus]|eukprot:PDM65296.1 helicase [Pristionchus pacificus]